MKKFNVYIVAIKGGDTHLIGSDMSEDRAEQRVMTGLMRIDRDSYFVGSYEVGSKQDLKLAKEVK